MSWLRRRRPRPAVGEVLPPELPREQIDRLAADIITLHNDVYHPGRTCREDEQGRCDAIEWGKP